MKQTAVTILDEPPPESVETCLLTEKGLAVDWLNPEEEAAWRHLWQPR